MALIRCELCDDPVSIQGSGPIAARAVLPPLKALCSSCIRRERLTVEQGQGHRGTRYDGQLYLEIAGAFVHSDHPLARHIYAAPFPAAPFPAAPFP